MDRPIVHIGYHKTATTWFQRAYYPQAGNLRYVDRLRVKDAFLGHSGFNFDPALAHEELGLRDADESVILCEEELSGYLHNGGLYGFLSMEMAKRIHATFPKARIVIFIRSQPDMIGACYQQYIRGGGTHSTRRYLHPSDFLWGAIADPYKVPRFSFDHFEYLHLIKHYQSLFGRDNVQVFLYEEFRRDAPAFLDRYAKQLGLDIDLEAVSMQARNASYSLPIVWLARLLNHFSYRTVIDKRTWIHIPGWYLVRRGILESLNRTRIFGGTPSPERLLGSEELHAIEERYREHNQRLAQHTGLPLEEYGYPV